MKIHLEVKTNSELTQKCSVFSCRSQTGIHKYCNMIVQSWAQNLVGELWKVWILWMACITPDVLSQMFMQVSATDSDSEIEVAWVPSLQRYKLFEYGIIRLTPNLLTNTSLKMGGWFPSIKKGYYFLKQLGTVVCFSKITQTGIIVHFFVTIFSQQWIFTTPGINYCAHVNSSVTTSTLWPVDVFLESKVYSRQE